LAFEWIYKHIQGNATKKDYDFQEVIELNFKEEGLIEFLEMLDKGKISASGAKDVMHLIIDGDERNPSLIAQVLGYLGGPISDEDLSRMSDLVIEDNMTIAMKVRAGEEGKLQALVGEMMRQTNKKADPKKINQMLKDKINAL